MQKIVRFFQHRCCFILPEKETDILMIQYFMNDDGVIFKRGTLNAYAGMCVKCMNARLSGLPRLA